MHRNIASIHAGRDGHRKISVISCRAVEFRVFRHYNQFMRAFRLFLVLLLSLALPLSNVAAAAMMHCAEPAPAAQASMEDAAGDMHGHGHEHHHAAQPDNQADHHQQHDASAKANAGCDHCSYCQSCASAGLPAVSHTMQHLKPLGHIAVHASDDVLQAASALPYRPPRPAFA
jgi:hypothetical protein